MDDASEQQSAKPQASTAPAITLPKGGGAIRGIGEKFDANPVTGTASLSIPLATSPGRAGFGPQLALSYDSGAGNGPFGFGWNLSLPSITRKTDKGLPRYLDAEESDVFVIAGSEDLVSVFRQDVDGTWIAGHPGHQRDPDGFWVRDGSGNFVVHEDEVDGYRVRRYRPRIEGLFARIERWSRIGDARDVHWRVISSENVLTIYGLSENARITDPADATRIFSWLICETRDDKGNAVLYRYKADDGEGLDLGQAHERNRGDREADVRKANRYLKRIHYGNRTPLLDNSGRRPRVLSPAQIAGADWMFEVVFDYGEHDAATPAPKDDEERNAAGALTRPWPQRPDAFSSYRSGFEIRTTRLCRRVLMFHHFPADPDVRRDCLVRSTDLKYSDEIDPASARNPVYAFLESITVAGYRRNNGSYDRRSLPALEFAYSEPIVQDTLEYVDAADLENVPAGVNNTYRWTDLHGEGVSGILAEHSGGWMYKRNLSPIPETLPDGRERVAARFAPTEVVATRPNADLSAGAEFMDLAGDGQPDVVLMNAAAPGLYEHDAEEGWQPFRAFTSRLSRSLSDPNVRLIDLDGDGSADVLITEDAALVWHASLGEAGFGPARRVPHPLDEEKGPRVAFADRTQSIHLADLTGDGLTDIIRIRNGEVCYWPNLGHGRFGAKVTMDNSPWFDNEDQFDHDRIRLADIDGSGTTDIIYLHRDGVRLYFNQSGNSWSQSQRLRVFPRIDDAASIVAADLLGNGTTCLVWSSPLAGDARQPMRYVNLMGARKPHLLIKTVNNLGAETRIDYAPSTRFYLEDRRDGRPWVTRLPFRVQVVERIHTFDHISRNHFVSRFAYHHGYFDGDEREFRGFGMVEQWDTARFAALSDGTMAAPENLDAESTVPPIHTKTWYHTGVYVDRETRSRLFEHEYFREPGLDIMAARPFLLDDTILPADLSVATEREACRALKGSMLRQEVYAADAGATATADQRARARTPYTVTEQNFGVRVIQPHGTNAHAIFLTHGREALSVQYERNAADPRIQHMLTLEVDDFGNVLKEAAIGYGRRAMIRRVEPNGQVQQVPNPGLSSLAAADASKQTTPLATYTEHRVTTNVDDADSHRTPMPCESRTFELTGYPFTGSAGRCQPSDLVEDDPAQRGRLRHKFAAEVAYEATAAGNQRRRPIEWTRTIYRRDDLASPLALGELQAMALPFESYRLAFTPGLLDTFRRPRTGQAPEILLPNPAAVLGSQAGDGGGYVASQALKADGRFPPTDADDHWWIPSGRSFFSPGAADSTAVEQTTARNHFFLPRRHRDPFGHDIVVSYDVNDLLIAETRDPLANRVNAAVNDYRVLQPRVVSDPNGNETAIAFDTLGMVAGTAVMGKPGPAVAEGDSLVGFSADLTPAQIDGLFNAADPRTRFAALLQDATTRIVYDFDRFGRSQRADPDDPTKWLPPVTATLARETHVHAPLPPQGLRIQGTFAYADGFGREIQKKVQAEAGPLVDGGATVNPRWLGTGWTIFNNKGKPVRQYEPFFSATHEFQFGLTVGVSPILFYDPAERVVVTIYPNHTFQKVLFDAWQQTTFDVNDTCAPRQGQTGDPRTDPDVSGFVAEYFTRQPAAWATWHAQRIGGALGAAEHTAADRAAAHANTPTTVHLDVLGRTFLTVARNRVVCAGHDLDGTEAIFQTRIALDIEGNHREVRDALVQAGDANGRAVMRYTYDMLGHRVYEVSMEAGARWVLSDAAGKPIRAWDSRGHNFVTSYDPLRRQQEQRVRGTSADSDPRTLNVDLLIDRLEYGEATANASAAGEALARQLNLRTRIYRHQDSAGVVTNAELDANGDPVVAYDFKGNLLRSTRRLATDYDAIPNWLLNPALEAESFLGATLYDALNRPVQSIAPHSSRPLARRHVIQPVFNEANLLERLDVWLERAADPAGLLDPGVDAPSPVGVANIDYDEKGQRRRVDYKNGVSTRYRYDHDTFRLTNIQTQRNAAGSQDLQNLQYTYDPAGNVTHVEDDAQQAIYFNNRQVEPSNDYTYDALYRLIQATGRQHLGQGAAPIPHGPGDVGRVNLPHPGDGNAMGTYIERYVYDAVANMLATQHRGSDPAHPGWERSYTYAETSLIEDGSVGPLKTSNRLTQTTLNPAAPNATDGPYQHDAHGNVVRMPHLGAGQAGSNLQWDYRDRLREVDLGGGGTATYVYDAAGQRVRKVWKKSAALIEERIYVGGFEIFRRHGGPIGPNTATLERETLHVLDDAQRVALVEVRTIDIAGNDPAPQRAIRYQFNNHLGSATLELDDQSQVVSYEEYSPFGSSTYQAVRNQTETSKRYRYTGRERDEETGFQYHGARYFAPWLCRWISCDPIGIGGGDALYVYAGANPVNKVDLTGDKPNDPKEKKKKPQKSNGSSQGKGKKKPPPKPSQTEEASPAAQSIIPKDLKAARKQILKWVADEPKPKRELDRLDSADPDSPEHNFRVAYAVNYALLKAGAKPGKDYSAAEFAKLSEKALWILTKDLRQADPKIGTSESLVLRDAQRYLYGSLGEKWLQRHIADKYLKQYGIPPSVAPYLPGKVIDRAYEDVVKKAYMARNAIEEEITGKNPGTGRGRKNMPHSRPGGENWYDLGLERFHAMNPEDGKAVKGSPFIVSTPPPFTVSVSPFLGHEDEKYIYYPGERTDKKTGEFHLAPGPKW